MRIPVIKVNDGGYEHIVGANSHDVLYVDEKTGGIQYLNMQCCEGTERYGGEQTMKFVAEPLEDFDVHGPRIQFVTVEELIGIAIKQMKESTESKLKMHEMLKVYLEEKGICQKKLFIEFLLAYPFFLQIHFQHLVHFKFAFRAFFHLLNGNSN